ncbi:putative amidase [plant metagenome]|uniref:Putative amidase n=2 Tax=root TaxID=1 RepID=A0A1C3K8U6_9BURK|nr:putative amidase [Orrella dioscoreae]SOE49298.1 putative amidase [Orrella dioscoreae]
MTHIINLDATELSRLIHARKVSCVEVMSAYLAQIERHNGTVNALVSLRDEEILLREAAALDAELAAGIDRGWMHGFPQAPKDLGAVAGMASTKGSPIYRAHTPTADSIVYARMRAVGSIFVGRSNVPEFGLGAQTYNTVFGATRNALDPRLTSGGSSGGAAVAVALHMLPVADGSDQMGSLRIPAAYNNIFGLRPSYGRVPFGPAADCFSQQLSTEGPMARNIPDMLQLLAVQSGYDARAPLSIKEPLQATIDGLARDFRGCRIAWLGDYEGYLATEPGLMDHSRRALAGFTALGCEIEDVAIDFSMDDLWQAWLVLRSYGVAATYGALYENAQTRAQLKPEAIWEIERGLALTAMDVARASIARTRWCNALARLFEQYEYLVLPSTQVYAFDAETHWPRAIDGVEMDTYHRWMEVVVGPTMAGLPALSVPAGFNARGQAAGLQIIGRNHADFGVLQLGHAYDQATRQSLRSSPLHPSPVSVPDEFAVESATLTR